MTRLDAIGWDGTGCDAMRCGAVRRDLFHMRCDVMCFAVMLVVPPPACFALPHLSLPPHMLFRSAVVPPRRRVQRLHSTVSSQCNNSRNNKTATATATATATDSAWRMRNMGYQMRDELCHALIHHGCCLVGLMPVISCRVDVMPCMPCQPIHAMSCRVMCVM